MTVINERALFLRTTDAEGRSHDGQFQWPLTIGTRVEAPDWNEWPECGGGLHGLLWGEGDGSLLNWAPDARWLVVEVDRYVVIDRLKAKAPAATVLFVGDRLAATTFLIANGAEGKAVVGATRIAGDGGTATAGHRGTATAGGEGTIVVSWWDATSQRQRLCVGYVGEDGILPNTPYRCDEHGNLVPSIAAGVKA